MYANFYNGTNSATASAPVSCVHNMNSCNANACCDNTSNNTNISVSDNSSKRNSNNNLTITLPSSSIIRRTAQAFLNARQ